MNETIPEGHKVNLETINQAARNGQMGLSQVKLKDKDEYHTLLCAFSYQGSEVVVTPLARLFDGDPYELYEGPV